MAKFMVKVKIEQKKIAYVLVEEDTEEEALEKAERNAQYNAKGTNVMWDTEAEVNDITSIIEKEIYDEED